MPELSWKAVRRGVRYCAPACGRGCTWAEYQAAKARAKFLAARLGKGWWGEVYENMGWFFRAVSSCGRIKVHGYVYKGKEEKHYTAYLSEPGSAGGRWTGQSRSPRAAVAHAIAAGKAELAEIAAIMEGL